MEFPDPSRWLSLNLQLYPTSSESDVVMPTLELIPDPFLYGLAILCFGGWIGLFFVVRMLFTGKLCTGRELAEKNTTILAMEQSNKELLKQNEAMLKEYVPSTNTLLAAIRQAAEEARS